jgi:2-amino-4-hydroxy-6-hydroxymethyldihydropteridine diphosphokinase
MTVKRPARRGNGDPVFVALGGNLSSHAGPPLATQVAALERLGALGVEPLKQSSWYTTAPVPASDQPWFINAVAEVDTALAPTELLAVLHQVEAEFGRARSAANAARTLDLDLLAYGMLVRTGEPPLLPHPRLHERRFVLEPLAEIAPNWVHPVLKRSARDLLGVLPPGEAVTILARSAHRP